MPISGGPDVKAYRIGRGRLYAVDAKTAADCLPQVVAVLASLAQNGSPASPLHGFHAQADGTYRTDFPGGQLLFDTQTLETRFVPRAR